MWVVPTGGGAPIQVTTDGNSYHPSWAPDASAIVFVSERYDAEHLWTQPLVDGHPAAPATIISDGWTRFRRFPAWSPDGSTVAFITSGSAGSQEVAVVPSAGGRARLVTTGAHAARARWSRSTGRLVVSGLWGGSEYQLRTVGPDGNWVSLAKVPISLGKTPSEAQFDLSPDGRFVIAAGTGRAGHVWIMEARSRSF